MPASGLNLPQTYGLQQAPVWDLGLVLTGAAATASQNSPDIYAQSFKGITVILDVSSAGTGSVSVLVQGKDYSNSSNYFTLLTSGAITSNGTTAHTLYPGITVASGANANTGVSGILPQWIRIRVVANNSNPVTYTVGGVLTS